MGVVHNKARIDALTANTDTLSTDLTALTGRVAALEGNVMTVTVTDISADLILPETCTGTGTIRTYGKIAVLDIIITATADNTAVSDPIYTIPETMRAKYDGDYFINPLAAIDSNFTYYVYENALTPSFSTDLSTGESVTFSVMWLIDPPEPDPTPDRHLLSNY